LIKQLKIVRCSNFVPTGKVDGRTQGMRLPYDIPCYSFTFEEGTLSCYDSQGVKTLYDMQHIEVVTIEEKK
jgi:hypothetical protein